MDETVESNGRLYLVTKVDPVLLVLPYLRFEYNCLAVGTIIHLGLLHLRFRSADRLQPLGQLLKDEEFPLMPRLVLCQALQENLDKVAERKGQEETVPKDRRTWSQSSPLPPVL